MTEIEIFLAGGGTALFTWALGLIFSMVKGGVSETNDF